MTFTVGIALTALLVSVISPIISNVINILHEDKVNKRKYDFEVLAIKYDNYLKAAGGVTNVVSPANLYTYKQTYGELLPIIPSEYREKFIQYHNYVINLNYVSANAMFPSLCEVIAEIYPKYK